MRQLAIVAAVSVLAGAIAWPALAADVRAGADTPAGKAGQVILDAAKGQTYIEAFARTNSPTNPFGVDLAGVAGAIGAKGVSGGTSGAIAAEGQLSILPQFNTPGARFGVSDVTPAIIPFAAMVAGSCIGGYVTGYPAPDQVLSTDMAGRECSAAAIDRALADQYPLKIAIAHSKSTGSAQPAAMVLGTAAGGSVSPDISFAGDTAPAAPGSDVDKVGQVILQAVNGRTVKQALEGGASRDNPFELDADPLLLAAGAYFLSNDNTQPLEKSGFSIYPDYVTPGGNFEASEATPPIMPFAFNRGGICQGGYVTGYPVPDKVYAVDMHGKVCNASTVDNEVHAAYDKLAAAAKPAAGSKTVPDAAGGAVAPGGDGPADNSIFDGHSASDHDLEMLVYAAYTGAYGRALRHDNYFSSQGMSFSDLRDAMRQTLDKAGYGAADIEAEPFDAADVAKACAADGDVHLRVAFNSDGTGISVVAVTGTRMAAYEYFPDKSSDLTIVHAQACLNAGSSAENGDRLPHRVSPLAAR